MISWQAEELISKVRSFLNDVDLKAEAKLKEHYEWRIQDLENKLNLANKKIKALEESKNLIAGDFVKKTLHKLRQEKK